MRGALTSAVGRGAWSWGPVPDLVIYGEGKKLLRSIEFLSQFPDVERVLYFGDLDPEGVGILECLRRKDRRVAPHEHLYRGLLARERLARPLGRKAWAGMVRSAFHGAGDLADRAGGLVRPGAVAAPGGLRLGGAPPRLDGCVPAG